MVQGQAGDRKSAGVFELLQVRKARKCLREEFDRAAMSRKRKNGPSETPRCTERWRDSLQPSKAHLHGRFLSALGKSQ